MVFMLDVNRIFALLNAIALLLLLAPAVARFRISGKWGRRLQLTGILILGAGMLSAAIATVRWYLE
jgi:hypothetical protein